MKLGWMHNDDIQFRRLQEFSQEVSIIYNRYSSFIVNTVSFFLRNKFKIQESTVLIMVKHVANIFSLSRRGCMINIPVSVSRDAEMLVKQLLLSVIINQTLD